MTGDINRVGKYRFIAKLGEGGMARVFLALAQGPSGFTKILVLKELREEFADDPEFRSMFLAEARLSAQLHHPNVVQTNEIVDEDGRLLIAMEYLEGQPLHVLLGKVGRENFPLNVYVHVLSHVLAGLHYAHELAGLDGTPLHLVHRDVSPQNTFITYDGQVKILDFGIAKISGAASRTKAGDFKGKVNYAAPEQILAQHIDHRADVFSVGVMLYEVLAKTRIGTGNPEMAIAHARVNGREPKIIDLNPSAPAELIAICEKAMAISLEDRYATAAAMHDDLENYLATNGARVGAKDLAALMFERFADRRAKVRALVEEQVKVARAAADDQSVTMVDIGSNVGGGDSASFSASGHSKSEAAIHTSSASALPARGLAPSSAPNAQSRPINRALLAVVALLPAVLLAFWLSQRSKQASVANTAAPSQQPVASAHVEPVASAANTASAPPAAPVVSATVTPSASAASTVASIYFSASPPNATIMLDGVATSGNPFKAQIAKDAKMHKVKVVAPGYITVEKIVSFADDVNLTIDLDKASGKGARPVEPGAAHPIDEKDPW